MLNENAMNFNLQQEGTVNCYLWFLIFNDNIIYIGI
jgi:hypothetical protein